MVAVDVARQRVVAHDPAAAARARCPRTSSSRPDGTHVLRRRHGARRRLGDRRAAPSASRLHPTGAGAHGLYPSRDARRLYVTNRGAGTISVISFAHPQGRRDVAHPGRQPRHGRRLGRRQGAVALRALPTRRSTRSTRATGRLLARIPVGQRAARPVRLAAAGPLLARAHRHPALAARLHSCETTLRRAASPRAPRRCAARSPPSRC